MDDLYPNDGLVAGVYEPPKDPEQERQATDEDNYMSLSAPVMEDVIAWFNEQIEVSQSIANVDLNGKLSAEAQVLAMQKLTQLLMDKRDELRTKFDAWQESRKPTDE